MTGALKMVRLDLFTMKSQLFAYLTPVISGFLGLYLDNPFIIIAINVAWFSALNASNIFAVQENNKLERLYGSVSIRQKDVVLGRYIFMFLSAVLSFLTAVIVSCGYMLFHNKTWNTIDILLALGISLVGYSAITGISFPIFFKLGYLKAKSRFMLTYFIILGILVMPFFGGGGLSLPDLLFSNKTAITVALLVGSILTQYISYRFSIHAYRNRA